LVGNSFRVLISFLAGNYKYSLDIAIGIGIAITGPEVFFESNAAVGA